MSLRIHAQLSVQKNNLQVSSRVSIPLQEIELQAVRSQGPGGQNVNKVSTAVHLFFDVRPSSLPEVYKQKLLKKKKNEFLKIYWLLKWTRRDPN